MALPKRRGCIHIRKDNIMNNHVILQNEKIKLTIAAMGAEMVSLIYNGQERIWEGNPDIWMRHAPVVFPICGGLRDGKYNYGGKTYEMGRHGFAFTSLFVIESATDTEATFLLAANAETKKQYPFDFEFRIHYSLSDTTVEITYSTTNKGDGEMYYSVGGHTGFACPEGVENYSVRFEKTEDLICTLPEEGLLGYEKVSKGADTDTLALNYDFCVHDSIIFEDLESKTLRLVNNTTGEEMELAFADMPDLVIWTKPGAGYICLEPWHGLSDYMDCDYDFTKKKDIICLAAGETKTLKHSMKF